MRKPREFIVRGLCGAVQQEGEDMGRKLADQLPKNRTAKHFNHLKTQGLTSERS